MIEKLNRAVRFMAFYSTAKRGKSGLPDVTVDVYDPTGVRIVIASAATEMGGGLYSYTLPAASFSLIGEYTAIFSTSDATVDMQDIPAVWVAGRAGIENLDAKVSAVPAATRTNMAIELARIDVPVSTRATAAQVALIPTNPLLASNYTAPPSAASIAAAVDAAVADNFSQVNTNIATVVAPGGAITLAVADIMNAATAGWPAGSAGAALNRLNVSPGAVIIPGPPGGMNLCRVFGIFVLPTGLPAKGIVVSFTLMTPGPTISSGPVAGRTTKCITDATGTLLDEPNGHPWVDLARNDTLTTAGSYYAVTCRGLGLLGARLELNSEMLNLGDIVGTLI